MLKAPLPFSTTALPLCRTKQKCFLSKGSSKGVQLHLVRYKQDFLPDIWTLLKNYLDFFSFFFFSFLFSFFFLFFFFFFFLLACNVKLSSCYYLQTSIMINLTNSSRHEYLCWDLFIRLHNFGQVVMWNKGETTSLATNRKELLVLVKEWNKISSVPVVSYSDIFADEILFEISAASAEGLRISPRCKLPFPGGILHYTRFLFEKRISWKELS